MQFQFSNIRFKSISFRLLAAFSAIGTIAVVSALWAWLSAADTEKKMDKIVVDILPLIRHSNLLSKDVSRFAVDIGDLANAQTKEELTHSITQLRLTSRQIANEIDFLSTLDFEKEFIAGLHHKIDPLIANMEKQFSLSLQALETHAKLHDAVQELTRHQDQFLKVARPRISKGYTDFLDEGREIGQDLRTFVAEIERGDRAPDLEEIDKELRIGFETLINTSAGEMRANLEMVAITFLVTGILYEAASVDDLEKITLLQKKFTDTEPFVTRIKMILSYARPENNQVLLKAFPILSAAKGEHSIFNIRREELRLLNLSSQNSHEAITLSERLSADVTFLANASEQFTDNAINQLQKDLRRYTIFTAFAAFITILIAFGIGLVYVNDRVIKRIGWLSKAMEDQAEGKESSIPSDSFNDEISDMTRALEKFVTQRREAARQLQQTLFSLNEAQHLARIGNCERNHYNHEWYWSEGFYKILGYHEDELSSSEENFWNVVHDEDRLRVERFFSTLDSNTQTSDIEFRMVKKGGAEISVNALWKLTEDDKDFTQHGTIQDVTDRKKIEEELLKIRKMESISILAGGIAHDFNNLLTGIIGNLALASRLLEDNHPVLENLNLSERAAIRARDLTSKLLTFSSGGNPIKSVTYLPQLLKETADFALTGSNVRCEYSIDEPLWPVDMDPSHINQIVQNLVVNANQAMEEGGIIYINCVNVTLDENDMPQIPSGNYVKITVVDSGDGIEPADINKIFDPYYTTKGHYTQKGSGLGLAIVHAIITKHGGTIEVTSKPGLGSNFMVYIPALSGAYGTTAEETLNAELTGSGCILVMDDEELIRKVTSQMLTGLGYKVVTVENGEEALDIYEAFLKQDRSIDAAIFDLTIPGGMGGKEAAPKLLNKHPDAKIIVSSGYSSDPVIQDFQSFGFCDILKKPYQLEELSRVVKRVLEQR